MPELLFHPLTKHHFDHYLRHPAHALIIDGPSGVGKYSAALSIAAELVSLSPDAFLSYPHYRHIAPIEAKQISIDTIRTLEHFLSLKIPGNKLIDRVVIIEQADMLSGEAQNALLKTLEEPPEGTLLMLLTPRLAHLLPTVRSRSQRITIGNPDAKPLQDFFVNLGNNHQQVTDAYTLSGGLPGLMSALLDKTDHPLRQAANIARDLLQSTTYQRLARVDELSKQRPLAEDMLSILQQMSRIRLADSRADNNRWLRILKASYDASQSLAAKSQAKLTLTSLMLNLG